MSKTMLFKVAVLSAMFLFSTLLIHAQEEEKTPLDSGSLNEQFEYVKKKSSTYNDFKVIKITRLNQMWRNALDSLADNKKKLVSSQSTVVTQKSTIDNLNNNVANLEEQLEAVTAEKDSISLIGIPMAKKNYHGLMWTMVLTLLALLGIAIYKFKDSNKVTVRVQKDYKDIHEDFELFKTKALEKERKLKRELQTELNKVEDLKRRISS